MLFNNLSVKLSFNFLFYLKLYLSLVNSLITLMLFGLIVPCSCILVCKTLVTNLTVIVLLLYFFLHFVLFNLFLFLLISLEGCKRRAIWHHVLFFMVTDIATLSHHRLCIRYRFINLLFIFTISKDTIIELSLWLGCNLFVFPFLGHGINCSNFRWLLLRCRIGKNAGIDTIASYFFS